MKYDTLVFIGRFQPFHAGHYIVVQEALAQAEEVIMVVGSSFASRSFDNPWTFAERKRMIRARFPQANLKIVPVMDYPYNDAKWVSAVRRVVKENLSASQNKIGLIGHKKDGSSYYLDIFNDWGSVAVEGFVHPDFGRVLSATDIRDSMFKHKFLGYQGTMDRKVSNVAQDIIEESEVLKPYERFSTLFDEFTANEEYKALWKSKATDKGWSQKFVCVDAVVIQSGKVLLIKRKNMPGKGLWAVPGGHLDDDERILDGVLRELKEETGLKIQSRVMRRYIAGSNVFDAPSRSSRGRTISHATFFDLGSAPTMPRIRGLDDAEKAEWVAFEDIKPEMMFEDHYHMIDFFTNIG